jgi:hypothetical protein
MKLGGTNVILEPQNISFLTDPANPTMVMGMSVILCHMNVFIHALISRWRHYSPSPWHTRPSVI